MLWSALEHGSTTLISFLSLTVFAKFLEPRDFGAYSIAFSIVEIAAIVPGYLFYEALIRFNNLADDHFNAAFTISIGLGVFVFALLWLILPSLASLVGDPRVSDIGRVLGLGLLIAGPASILSARQSREFGFRVLAQRTLLGRIAGSLLGIVAVFFHFGVWALVIQYLSMTVLGSTALVIFSSWRPRLTIMWRPGADLLNYGLGSVVSLSATFVSKRAFGLYVGVFLGVEKAGFLNLAFRIFDTVWAISSTAISDVMLPVMARFQDDHDRALKAYRTTLTLGCALLYPAFAGLGVVAPELIQLLFGDRWMPAARPALWLGALIFVQAPRIFQISLLKITGNIGGIRWVTLATLTFMIIGIITTKLPSETLALALWAVTESLTFALLSFLIQEKLQFSIIQQLRIILVPLLASCAMAWIVSLARNFIPTGHPSLRLFYLCLIGLIVYAGLMLLFGRRSIARVLQVARLSKIPDVL